MADSNPKDLSIIGISFSTDFGIEQIATSNFYYLICWYIS